MTPVSSPKAKQKTVACDGLSTEQHLHGVGTADMVSRHDESSCLNGRFDLWATMAASVIAPKAVRHSPMVQNSV
jgi:hypothetical protein